MPTGGMMPEIATARVQDLGEDLGRFDQSRARTIEELVTVGDKNPTLGDRP